MFANISEINSTTDYGFRISRTSFRSSFVKLAFNQFFLRFSISSVICSGTESPLPDLSITKVFYPVLKGFAIIVGSGIFIVTSLCAVFVWAEPFMWPIPYLRVICTTNSRSTQGHGWLHHECCGQCLGLWYCISLAIHGIYRAALYGE